MKTFVSDISKQEYPVSERISGRSVRKTMLALIQQDHPGFTEEGYLSVSELNFYREKYMSEYISKQIGTLSELEQTVVDSLRERTILTDKLDGDEKQLTLGQKLADKVADFGGSWPFIISFGVFLFLWILTNVYWLSDQGFDPYPFILLNLILSCIAAIQAPVIMMSQNRQEEKDRERARKDYMINLKAEVEIRTLHEKIDHLILHQQPELLEIQKMQIEMMEEILEKRKSRNA